ncbi:MAG: hypothetical protein IT376_10505 [Polyangiaceae bacterium]|nr:hypothetical protein [Polyangiaceae bacterium]
MIEDADPDGRWVALCQARADDDRDGRIDVRIVERGATAGDRLRLYLVQGAGEGAPIDALLARDPAGRHLVVSRGGRATLVDATTRAERELEGADLRQVDGGPRRHRAFDFDAAGERLAWLRRRGSKTEVVVSVIGSGDERVLDAGAGEILGVRLDPLARWVVVDAVASDGDGNGRLDWPWPTKPAPAPRCALPVPAHRDRAAPKDRVVRRAARLDEAALRDVPGLLAPVGEALLVRDADGALVLDRAGARAELAPAACGGRVVHVDAERGRVVVACAGASGRPTLHLGGAGSLRELALPRADGEAPAALTLAVGETDAFPGPPSRLLALHAGRDTALLDLSDETLHALPPRAVVIATHGERALVAGATSLTVVRVGAEDALAVGAAAPSPDVVVGVGVGVVSPWVVDLARGEVLGTIDRRPLAVSRDGRALVAEGADADAGRLASGPARWVPAVAR